MKPFRERVSEAMEGMNFIERAREAGYEIQVERLRASHGLASKLFLEGLQEGFVLGAEWGMRQAVEELRLRADGIDAPGWADWLLEKAGME